MAANSALGATKLFAPLSTDPPVDTDKIHLSKKKIPREERLIFALDVPEDRARELISQLGDSVRFYKLGLQLFMSGSYFALLEELTEQKKKVFIDLKFFDVPETVALAVAQLRGRGATFVSVHGNEDILKAACDEENGVQIIAVTVLTSFDQRDIVANATGGMFVEHRSAKVRPVNDGAGVPHRFGQPHALLSGHPLEKHRHGDLMPAIVDAFRVDATLGETMGVLRQVFDYGWWD